MWFPRRLSAAVVLALVVHSAGSLANQVQLHPVGVRSAPGTGLVRAIVLGVAQDAGFPHIGCHQEPCRRARREPAQSRAVASLGLVDEGRGKRFLIDATPDMPAQIEALGGVDGILLTHAHMGHYMGLLYLGREGLGARAIPVYATARMAAFLRANGPWSQLVALNNIELREIEPDRELRLTSNLAVTPFSVPHRDEFSDTVGFKVVGPNHRLIYIPDIDKWARWSRRLGDEVAQVDFALVDGTFEKATEIPGRSQDDIPHPLIGESLAAVPNALRGRLRFVHLNHTNRLLWDPSAAGGLGPAAVARQGEEFGL